jgi:hypothetical protein
LRNRSGRRIRAQKYPGGAGSFNLIRVRPQVRFRDAGDATSALSASGALGWAPSFGAGGSGSAARPPSPRRSPALFCSSPQRQFMHPRLRREPLQTADGYTAPRHCRPTDALKLRQRVKPVERKQLLNACALVCGARGVVEDSLRQRPLIVVHLGIRTHLRVLAVWSSTKFDGSDGFCAKIPEVSDRLMEA